MSLFKLLFSILLILAAGLVFWSWQGGKFGKFERLNLVLATDPVTLISLDSTTKEATVVTIPSDLQVFEVVPNFGSYQMGAVYKLGQLDGRGGQVLSWTVGELLGIPVDGYIYQPAKIGNDVKKFFLSPTTIFGAKSNLNFLDRLRFAAVFWQIRFDKIMRVDLGSFAEALVLADGSTGRAVEKGALDNLLAENFLEANLRTESLRVEVVNSTQTSALGQRAARVLTNIGVEVVNVGTSADLLPSCELRARQDKLGTNTVKRLANIFSCKVVAYSALDRSDVSLVLGKDYADRYLK